MKVEALQQQGKLPDYAANRIFLVFTHGLKFGGYGSNWCGYHAGRGPGKFYAHIPYPERGWCGDWSGQNDLHWQMTTSHEINEAATDPDLVTPGWTAGGNEGADECADQSASLCFGTVQLFDDNQQGTCSLWTPRAGRMWHTIHNPDTIQLESLGGSLAGPPTAVSWGPDRLDVLAAGSGNTPWHWWWDGAKWTGPIPLPTPQPHGIPAVGVAVVSLGPNRLDAFAAGPADTPWWWRWTGNGWSPPLALPPAASVPGVSIAATSSGKDILDVFALGRAGDTPWWWQGNGTVWSVVQPLPHVTSLPDEGIAAISPRPGRLDVFAAGGDNQLWHWWREGSPTWNTEPLGGDLPAEGVSVVSSGANRMDVFAAARGWSGNPLQHWWWDGTKFHGPDEASGNLTQAAVGAVPTTALGRADVFGVSGDKSLNHWQLNGSTWIGPIARGGNLPAGDVSAVAPSPGRIDVFARGGDNGLQHWVERDWAAAYDLVEDHEQNDPGPFMAVSCAGVGGSLQVVGLSENGRMWHTIRNPDGSWYPRYGLIEGQEQNDPGAFRAISCAAVIDTGGLPQNTLHVVGQTFDGQMWHTIRYTNKWQPAYDLVDSEGPNLPGPFTTISCAGILWSLHLVALAQDGRVWHRMRNPDGIWTQYELVPGQNQLSSEAVPTLSPFNAVTCAGVGAALHVVGLSRDGQMWHTIRNADGWLTTFEHVETQEQNNPGPFLDVSCAGVGDSLEVLGLSQDGQLWHTVRYPNEWQPTFDLVAIQELNSPGRFLAVSCAATARSLHVVCVALG